MTTTTETAGGFNLDLTEEQRLIRDTVREFARDVVEPRSAEADETSEFPWPVWEGMKELGLTGIPFDDAWGGAGADFLSYALAVEELARVDAGIALTLAAHTSLGTVPIDTFGTDEQKQQFMPDLCAGDKLGSFGLTEPGAGSDAGGTRTTATRADGGWVLNGTKIFITNAGIGHTFVATAVTDKAKGHDGISSFIVEKGMDGFSLGSKDEKLGCRSSDWAELVFEDCFVPEDHLLGEEGQGFRNFMKTLDGGRIVIGALGLGIAQGCLDKSVPHAREREAFGRPIGSFQGVGFMLADMAMEVEAARHLVYNAARLKDAGRPFGLEASMAKLFASETAMRAADSAIQVYGGYGFSREYPLERYYRDAKLCEIGEGTSEIQRLVISRHILGKLDVEPGLDKENA